MELGLHQGIENVLRQGSRIVTKFLSFSRGAFFNVGIRSGTDKRTWSLDEALEIVRNVKGKDS
jgi:hypothetical protein